MISNLPSQSRSRGAKRNGQSGTDHQMTFDAYKWNWGHRFPLLNVSEVAEMFDCSEMRVRDMADEGRFLSFAINVEAAPKREHLRIVRSTCNTDLRRMALENWEQSVATINDWLLTNSRQVITVKESAIALRCFDTHIRALVDARELLPVHISAVGCQREHLRIVRTSLVDFVKRRIELKFGKL